MFSTSTFLYSSFSIRYKFLDLSACTTTSLVFFRFRMNFCRSSCKSLRSTFLNSNILGMFRTSCSNLSNSGTNRGLYSHLKPKLVWNSSESLSSCKSLLLCMSDPGTSSNSFELSICIILHLNLLRKCSIFITNTLMYSFSGGIGMFFIE